MSFVIGAPAISRFVRVYVGLSFSLLILRFLSRLIGVLMLPTSSSFAVRGDNRFMLL